MYRLSSLRCEGFDLRADARTAQASSVRPQFSKLQKTKDKKKKTIRQEASDLNVVNELP